MNKNIKKIIRLAIVAALYVVLTVALSFISYGNIQFRIAEILIFLCFFRKDYVISLVLGCLIANFFSPLGIIDVAFGTFATLISALCVSRSKNIIVASIFPTVFNAVIVGIELKVILELPLFISMLEVFAGEAVVILIGCCVFSQLKKSESFMELIEAEQNCDYI